MRKVKTKMANQNPKPSNPFKLDRARAEKVSSTVYTLTLDTPEGTVKIGGNGAKFDSKYMHKDNDEKQAYKFVESRMIPLLPEDAGKDRDTLMTEINTWLDAVQRYHEATSYVITGDTFKTDGKHRDPQSGQIVEHKKGDAWPDSRELKKSFGLLDYKERGKDNRTLTAEELLVQLLRDSFTLRNQASMQDTLRGKAEDAMRVELNLAQPSNGKVKKVKEPQPGQVEEDDVEGL